MADLLFHRAIKLTFVPNQFCNLGCTYCYLGDLTNNRDDPADVVAEFSRICEHLAHQGILIDQQLLHGAEISTLPIHIKTNLYNFHQLRPLFEEYEVSISGSFDLPFSLHEKFRVTKAGKSTLKRTVDNVLLLGSYPHRKKISCVVGREHLERIDEFVADLRWLDEHGFDMVTDFYIMFAYDSVNSGDSSQLDQAQMVEFFEGVLDRVRGTKFERAVYYEWFKEFTHGYCTHQINCGATNFLVQKNGDVYPCHRAQAEPDLKFGNIHQLGLPEIAAKGAATIRAYEAANEDLSAECIACEYFYLCYAGCPIERNNNRGNRAYTCGIQKALYRAQRSSTRTTRSPRSSPATRSCRPSSGGAPSPSRSTACGASCSAATSTGG